MSEQSARIGKVLDEILADDSDVSHLDEPDALPTYPPAWSILAAIYLGDRGESILEHVASVVAGFAAQGMHRESLK